MTNSRVNANLVMRILGDDLPFPYLVYDIYITEGRCEERLALETYKTIRNAARDDFLDYKNNNSRPLRTLYTALKDVLPLSISLSSQPLIQAFSEAPLDIGRENRALHPIDELCLLQAIVQELSARDQFFSRGTWPIIQTLGNKPINPRVYHFLRKAYRELLPAGNIYKPASLNPRHGQEEKVRRAAAK